MREGSFLARWLWVLLLVAGTESASTQGLGSGGEAVPQKPAWKWTLDERLAARFDASAIADRDAKRRAEEDAIRRRWGGSLLAEDEVKMTGPPAATDTIDGRKNPELLLPVELFGALLRRGLPPQEEKTDIQETRSRIEQRAVALGFGRDLWDRLEKVTGRYLKLVHNEDRRRLATGARDYKSKEDQTRICRAHREAMEAAKAEFGEEAFLRLLYEAVAPDFQPTYIFLEWPPDYQRHEELLRSLEEGGCGG